MSNHATPVGPRVLIDCGDHAMGNLGDVAMLQVTVQRLREQLPAAALDVITRDPDALALHCPGARPVSYEGRQLWAGRGILLGRADRFLRQARLVTGGGPEAVLRRNCASLHERLIHARMHGQRPRKEAFDRFMRTLGAADAVVVCGAGGVTDHAAEWATALLDVLAYAVARHHRTAMFSHGLGPITNPELRRLARRVLPQLDLLALRERRAGEPLARSLGVAPGRLCVTGDDAIELAYAARPTVLGNQIGINLRVARSAGVDESYVDPVGTVVRQFAGMRNASLIPLPIGRGTASNDVATLRRLFGGLGLVGDGGVGLNTPDAVIRQVSRCRIVVTGSYHAAVFACAQGIPAICLARSLYFWDKFLGLADQFGRGCSVVDLGARDLPSQLLAAIQCAWDSADEWRNPLLEAARHQIEASRSAYQRFARMLLDRAAPAHPQSSTRKPGPLTPERSTSLQAASRLGESQ